MTDTTINPLDSDQFYAQNVTWLTESAKMLEVGDTTNLHLDIARRAMQARSDLLALTKNGRALTRSEREERKRLHHTMQVLVPAFRRSRILQRNLAAKNHKASLRSASRLAVFLLSMVAQSTLFPESANLTSFASKHESALPKGLGPVHRSVALSILRDNAELFAACPAWVEPVVVNPMHLTAANAMHDNAHRMAVNHRVQLRKKILALGVLTADEEQLLMRIL